MPSENKEAQPADTIVYFQNGDIKGAYQGMLEREIEFTNATHKIHTHEYGTEKWMAFSGTRTVSPWV